MRGVVRRHRLQKGDRFVLEGEMYTIINGRLAKPEVLSAPIFEIFEDGKRCVLEDGVVIVGDGAAYIDRENMPANIQDNPNAGREFEL